MKKIVFIMCAVLLIFGIRFTAYADEMKLTVNVPEEHSVKIVSDGGRVILSGEVCEQDIQVKRHSKQIYRIVPDTGKEIDRVFYNEEDVTSEVKKGVFVAEEIVNNAKLEVNYRQAPAHPDNMKYEIAGSVVDESGSFVSGAKTEIGGISTNTDKDGNFILTEIPSGKHQIVVTYSNGKIAGCGEIIIEKATGDKLEVKVSENGTIIVCPGKGTERIGLILSLTGDGALEVKDVRDVTPRAPIPVTGDGNNVLIWGLLAMVSATLLLTVYIKGRLKG